MMLLALLDDDNYRQQLIKLRQLQDNHCYRSVHLNMLLYQGFTVYYPVIILYKLIRNTQCFNYQHFLILEIAILLVQIGLGIFGVTACTSNQIQNVVNEKPETFKDIQKIATLINFLRMGCAIVLVLVFIYLFYIELS